MSEFKLGKEGKQIDEAEDNLKLSDIQISEQSQEELSARRGILAQWMTNPLQSTAKKITLDPAVVNDELPHAEGAAKDQDNLSVSRDDLESVSSISIRKKTSSKKFDPSVRFQGSLKFPAEKSLQ